MLKVEANGILDDTKRWIGKWLEDRKQRVVLNGESSGWMDVYSGVLQGSVLGPLLFLIYINDLDNKVKSAILKFADDTKALGRVANADEIRQLRRDLDLIVD